MSLDQLVFSPRGELIDEAALVAELANRGWETAIPPRYVFIGGARERRTTIEDRTIYGWQPGAVDAARVRELVAQIPLTAPSAREPPWRQLDQMPELCACDVHGQAFTFEPGELEDYEELDAELRRRLAETRTQYVVRSSTRQRVDYADGLWQAIATVAGGVRRDPQAGDWI